MSDIDTLLSRLASRCESRLAEQSHSLAREPDIAEVGRHGPVPFTGVDLLGYRTQDRGDRLLGSSRSCTCASPRTLGLAFTMRAYPYVRTSVAACHLQKEGHGLCE